MSESGNQARETIQAFWDIQNERDYTKTVALFAEDALFVDPIFGTFEGRDAIGAFMAKMNVEMGKLDAEFDLVELSGGGDTAWAQWRVTTNNKPPREGVGVYKVSDGQITYYRDYMNS